VKYTLLSTAELLRMCATTIDAGPWEELIRRFHSLIVGVVVRSARRWSEHSQAVHEELVQDAYFKLFRERHNVLRSLADVPDRAMPSFLKTFTANLVHDYFRSLHAAKRRPSAAVVEFDDERAVSAGLTAVSGVEREILLSEVDALLEAQVNGITGERDRQIFWLHHRHGMTAREIASIKYFHLTEKGVESVLFRLTTLVKDGMQRNSVNNVESEQSSERRE
jgi:RNA polymerase sigma factor (sigma-70 family)